MQKELIQNLETYMIGWKDLNLENNKPYKSSREFYKDKQQLWNKKKN